MMQLVKSGLWAAPWDKQLCQAEKKWKGIFRPSLHLSAHRQNGNKSSKTHCSGLLGARSHLLAEPCLCDF